MEKKITLKAMRSNALRTIFLLLLFVMVEAGANGKVFCRVCT